MTWDGIPFEDTNQYTHESADWCNTDESALEAHREILRALNLAALAGSGAAMIVE
jgi:hypothetical protein